MTRGEEQVISEQSAEAAAKYTVEYCQEWALLRWLKESWGKSMYQVVQVRFKKFFLFVFSL